MHTFRRDASFSGVTSTERIVLTKERASGISGVGNKEVKKFVSEVEEACVNTYGLYGVRSSQLVVCVQGYAYRSRSRNLSCCVKPVILRLLINYTFQMGEIKIYERYKS